MVSKEPSLSFFQESGEGDIFQTKACGEGVNLCPEYTDIFLVNTIKIPVILRYKIT